MKLRIACIVMAVVCAALVPYTAMSVYKSVTQAEDVYAEGAAVLEPPLAASPLAVSPSAISAVPEEAPGETLSSFAESEPLALLNLSPVILYDPAAARIYFPSSKSPPPLETNYFYNVHSIKLDGEAMGLKRLFLGGAMVRGVDFIGSTLAIRTQKGSFAEMVRGEIMDYIQLTDPKEIYKTIVVIDPGHGGADIGAPNYNETVFEKDINLNIANNLLAIADREDILILPTRTEDVLIEKDDRAMLGNMMGDYFIAIHCNADDSSTRSSGTVTYYYDEETEGGASEAFAQTVQKEIAAAFARRDRGILSDGGYRVLAVSEIPAVIAELLFMTNPEDLALLTDPAVQMKAAEAFKRVIERLP